ncbi:MAG: S8 family serine peptidase [Gemmatimonadetes bacterium]|nr:S8 family serine peptidase [Gemmatimonadota bacterium]
MEIEFARAVSPASSRTKSWRTILALLTAVIAAALTCVLFANPATADDDDDDDGGEYVSRQVVVELKPAGTVGYVNRKYGTRTISKLPGGGKIYLLKTPRRANPAKLARRIAADGRVLYAEPNLKTGTPEGSARHKARPGGTPEPSSDPTPYLSQYAVDTLNLPEAHGVNRGDGSVVAVIDTGVQADHPELAGKVIAGYDFIDGESDPADVGNGRDDDRDGTVDEMVGHGTHVAGIVALVAPEAEIMPIRALDTEGRGTTFGIAKAIQFATRNGADVVNLSLGSSRESDLLEDFIEEDDDDGERGPVFVAAAGNDNNALEQHPAAEEDVVSVTAVDSEKKKSEFANFSGGDEKWVTVAAPGTDIYAPFPQDRYAMWSGTSMATPFVAGQAALIQSAKPMASAECVTGIIDVTADKAALDAANPTFVGRLGSGHADLGASTDYAANQPRPCADTDDD